MDYIAQDREQVNRVVLSDAENPFNATAPSDIGGPSQHSGNPPEIEVLVPTDTVFNWSGFLDQYAGDIIPAHSTLAELAAVIQNARAPRKDDLPWIKLATFGDKKSRRGSYRRNANVDTITGIEGDYD